jgi:hypothetical protein
MQLLRLTLGIGAPRHAIALVLFGFSSYTQTTAGAEPRTMPYVGILVRNLSAAPAELVQKAEADCQQMYHNSAIGIAWMNSLDKVTWRGPDVVLEVVILPQAPPSRAMGAFGTALRGRREALIYHDRVGLGAKLADLPVQSVAVGSPGARDRAPASGLRRAFALRHNARRVGSTRSERDLSGSPSVYVRSEPAHEGKHRSFQRCKREPTIDKRH